MKAHERREAGISEDFFKLDRFDPRIGTFRPTKGRYESREDAERAAKAPGRYRIVACEGRRAVEGEHFVV